MTINYKQMTNLRNVRLSFNELPVLLFFSADAIVAPFLSAENFTNEVLC